MKKFKRLLTSVLTLATVFTALPISQVHVTETHYWTDAQEFPCRFIYYVG